MKRFIQKEGNQFNWSLVRRKLAVSFSFPVQQSTLHPGFIRWNDSAITEMVDSNIANCISIAMHRRGLRITRLVSVDDNLGALSFGYYQDPDTVAAVIFGTQSNACYLERTNEITKFRTPDIISERMVGNMLWANFCSSLLPTTTHDRELNLDESLHPNDRAFEKMIGGGMYLGEIIRRVILRMSEESDIFGTISPILSMPYVLRTTSVSAMHEDNTPELKKVAMVLKYIGVSSEVPLEGRKLVVNICEMVTRRAAKLAAAGIAGILKKIGRDGSGGRRGSDTRVVAMRRTVVVVEGELYLKYRMFREYMKEGLIDILGERVAQHVVIKGMENGSDNGSALLVASLDRIEP